MRFKTVTHLKPNAYSPTDPAFQSKMPMRRFETVTADTQNVSCSDDLSCVQQLERTLAMVWLTLVATAVACLLAGTGCEAGALTGVSNYRNTDGAYETLGEPTTGMPEVGFLTAQIFRGDAICSATLVAPDRVITARHCVNTTANRHGLAFVLGNSVEDSRREVYQVSRVAPHGDGDLAVLTLARPTPFQGLPILSRPLAAGETVTLVGYGETGWDARGSGHKRAIQVPVSGPDSQDASAVRLARLNGCVGESGGAALVEVAGQWHLAGVGQAVRAAECEYGSLYARVDGARSTFLLSARGIAAMAVCANQGEICNHSAGGTACCSPYRCTDINANDPGAGARCSLSPALAAVANVCRPPGVACNNDQDCCDWTNGVRCAPSSPDGTGFVCRYAPQRAACRLAGQEESCATCNPLGAFCNADSDCCSVSGQAVHCEGKPGGGGQCVVHD